MGYRLALVGATGLVGRTMLEVLAKRCFPVEQLDLYASARSAGTSLHWNGMLVQVQELTSSIPAQGYDLALFSAGSAVSKQYAPLFAEHGTVVIDNSSAWRAAPHVPLVVPEVNGDRIYDHSGIIANPNCSTIQLAVALAPLVQLYGLKRVVVATYQSVSGAGQRGLDQLEAELQGTEPPTRISTHPLAHNAVFHPIGEDGWSEEERKVMTELRRILGLPELEIIATCVRLPFFRSHCEAVWVECQHTIDLNELLAAYAGFPSIRLATDPKDYPTPRAVAGSDEVWIGRIRRDPHNPHAVVLWIVADNVRKGAATNAVQIAELLHDHRVLRITKTTTPAL